MPGLSSSAAQSILNALGNATAYSVATPYIQLHVSDPGSAGTSGVAVNNVRKLVSFATATGGALTNDAAIDWLSVSGTEDYTHFTIWDAAAAGTFVFSGTITAAAVTAGDNFSIPIGDLDVSLTTA